jgi:dienelactone hydrolase
MRLLSGLLVLLGPLVAACGSAGTTAAGDAGSPRDGSTHGDSASHDEAGRDAGGQDAAAGPYGPYASDGSETVTIASATVSPAHGTSFTVSLYVPSSTGPHPVVVLSSGFTQAALGYGPYAERLASWGIVAVLRNDPGIGEATTGIVSDVAYVVTTWLAEQNGDKSSPLGGKVDSTRIGLAGHSRGGQVSLLAAEGGAKGKLKGVFGLDPVDTSMDASPEARTTIATLGVPIAFVGETTDGVGTNACAPAADNYEVLYAAAASPAVAITAIGADHTMFEDPAHCFFCTLCTAGTADASKVLAYSVRYMMAFFARELLGDSSVGPSFDGAGAELDIKDGLTTVQSK